MKSKDFEVLHKQLFVLPNMISYLSLRHLPIAKPEFQNVVHYSLNHRPRLFHLKYINYFLSLIGLVSSKRPLH